MKLWHYIMLEQELNDKDVHEGFSEIGKIFVSIAVLFGAYYVLLLFGVPALAAQLALFPGLWDSILSVGYGETLYKMLLMTFSYIVFAIILGVISEKEFELDNGPFPLLVVIESLKFIYGYILKFNIAVVVLRFLFYLIVGLVHGF